MIRSMLCALVMFLGLIIAPTSAYPTGKVVEVTEADFDAQVAKGPTLVDVYADWCGHCRQLAPVWEELAKELEGEVYVVKVNGPKCRSLQQRLHVKAYPSILYLRDGEMRSYDGAQRTVQALAAFARKGWRRTKPVPFYMAPNNWYGRSVGWVYKIPAVAREAHGNLRSAGWGDVSIIFATLAVPVAAGMFAIFVADVWVVRTTRAQGAAARRRDDARRLLREQQEALERMNRVHAD